MASRKNLFFSIQGIAMKINSLYTKKNGLFCNGGAIMSVLYNPKTKQFYLHTKNSSYVMELYENHLAHSYWGIRINEIPNLEHYYAFRFGADFSATDIPGKRFNSTDKLRQEYPTYGTGDMRSPALYVENTTGDAITGLRYESHRIFDGKPVLSGLPATYGDDCETLEITLTDGQAQKIGG